jgi:hypothetical protein
VADGDVGDGGGRDEVEVADGDPQQQQRIQFYKNLAMIGGLLFAVLDRP